jgi:hypothetical protein
MNHDDSTQVMLPHSPGRAQLPPVELPAVIRPRPSLEQIETLAAHQHPPLLRLTQLPGQVDFLAGILFARDAAARCRFDCRQRLADHLRDLLAQPHGSSQA